MELHAPHRYVCISQMYQEEVGRDGNGGWKMKRARERRSLSGTLFDRFLSGTNYTNLT